MSTKIIYLQVLLFRLLFFCFSDFCCRSNCNFCLIFKKFCFDTNQTPLCFPFLPLGSAANGAHNRLVDSWKVSSVTVLWLLVACWLDAGWMCDGSTQRVTPHPLTETLAAASASQAECDTSYVFIRRFRMLHVSIVHSRDPECYTSSTGGCDFHLSNTN